MTHKYLVLGTPRSHATEEAIRARLTAEIEATWRDYRSGFIRELYEREARARHQLSSETFGISSFAPAPIHEARGWNPCCKQCLVVIDDSP